MGWPTGKADQVRSSASAAHQQQQEVGHAQDVEGGAERVVPRIHVRLAHLRHERLGMLQQEARGLLAVLGEQLIVWLALPRRAGGFERGLARDRRSPLGPRKSRLRAETDGKSVMNARCQRPKRASLNGASGSNWR